MDDRFLYGEEYFVERGYGVDQKRDAQYLLDVDKICSRVSDKATYILDVGCGNGEFLNKFGGKWVLYGVEPSDYAAKIAVNKGITILDEHYKNFAGEDFFDVVVYRGTLQHMSNPIDILYETTFAMKSGGMLAILATPNTDSLGYWRWKTLPALDAPRNWIPFGQHMLKNILIRLGYENIEFKFPYEKPYANPLKDLGNFIIGKPTAFPGNMMEVFAWKK